MSRDESKRALLIARGWQPTMYATFLPPGKPWYSTPVRLEAAYAQEKGATTMSKTIGRVYGEQSGIEHWVYASSGGVELVCPRDSTIAPDEAREFARLLETGADESERMKRGEGSMPPKPPPLWLDTDAFRKELMKLELGTADELLAIYSVAIATETLWQDLSLDQVRCIVEALRREHPEWLKVDE